VVSLSSRVLPEGREYKRSMSTLVDAVVKPRVSRYSASIAERLADLLDAGVPLYVISSSGGVTNGG